MRVDSATTESLVNAAKAWHRADDENRERREKTLHKMVDNYLQAEQDRRGRMSFSEAFTQAAADKAWLDGDGVFTSYTELEGKHLYNIRRKVHVEHEHFDGICEEVQRRADEADKARHAATQAFSGGLIWAEGIPFLYEKSADIGDRLKISFRNVLNKKLDHIEVDPKWTIVSMTGFRGKGLTTDQGHALVRGYRKHFNEPPAPGDRP